MLFSLPGMAALKDSVDKGICETLDLAGQKALVVKLNSSDSGLITSFSHGSLSVENVSLIFKTETHQERHHQNGLDRFFKVMVKSSDDTVSCNDLESFVSVLSKQDFVESVKPYTVVFSHDLSRSVSAIENDVKSNDVATEDQVNEEPISTSVRALSTNTSNLANDPLFSQQWGFTRVKAGNLWSQSTGDGALVGIVGYGMNFNHPDLMKNIWINGNCSDTNSDGEVNFLDLDTDSNNIVSNQELEDANSAGCQSVGYDFVDNDINPTSTASLSDTPSAGVIAAVANNNLGIAGLAPNAKLMSIRVFQNTVNDGSFIDVNILANALTWACNNNVKILHHSYGYFLSPQYSLSGQDTLNAALQYCNDLGSINIAMAGDTYSSAEASFPAQVKNIIPVAAADENDVKTDFSSFDHCITCPQKYVYISGPGSDIVTTSEDGGYANFSGTQMAASFVTGVLGLLVEQYPNVSFSQFTEILDSVGDNKDVSFPYAQDVPGMVDAVDVFDAANQVFNGNTL